MINDQRSEFKGLLAEAVHMFGITGAEERLGLLAKHAELVLEWNERAGLTTIVDPAGMAAKHFVDSLSLLRQPVWTTCRSAVDVGSGAGFPGLVLAICLPLVEFVLLEASAKKADFLRHAAATLGVEASVVHARAEDFGRVGKGDRERFDVGVARAAAPLTVACEYVLPLVRRGGAYLALVGPRDGAALARLAETDTVFQPEAAWSTLGAQLEDVSRIELPWGQGERYVARFRKRTNTPASYPRKAGTPERRPLPGFPS